MTPAEIKDAVWSARLLAEGRVIMLGDAVTLAVCKALLQVADRPALMVVPTSISFEFDPTPGAVTFEIPFPSSPLQAIEVCPCGAPLPHAAPCAKSTDPEQGS